MHPILLFLVIAIILIVLLQTRSRSKPKPKKCTPIIQTKQYIDGLYDLLRDVDNILGHYNIMYWLIAGSALGFARHQGMIPWDDDIDIGIMQEDLSALYAIQPVLDQFNIELRLDDHIHRLKRKGSEFYIDVFVYTNVDGVYNFADEFNRSRFRKHYFLPNEIFPLQRGLFGIIASNAPKSLIAYLNRAYPNWDTKQMVYLPHNNVPDDIDRSMYPCELETT